MRFAVLGPVAAWRGGTQLPLGGPKQRTVLALLIAARGRVVSAGELIDGVWGHNEPATAKKALQGYVHHLRTHVGDALRTVAGGYLLECTGVLDAEEFESLAARISAHHLDDPASVAELARTALGLWTGRCYADIAETHGLAAEIANLDNLRLEVLGARLDADLALGRHAAVVGELEGLVEEYPLHDRFRTQLMLALYRAGRQIEALRLFERSRLFLADELGLDPSPELKELERKILNHDPSLDISAQSDQVDAIRGYELREVIASHGSTTVHRGYQRSLGREVLIALIDERVANDTGFIANHVSHARHVARVDHPNIAPVFDTWREPGRAYQVGRWLSGGPLSTKIREGPMSLPRAMRAIDEIGGALAQAHRQGIAHGDITSAAVWFDGPGHAYLRDFQVATTADGAGFAADRLAFSALVHEMLTGTPPRASDSGNLECDREHLSTAVGDVLDEALAGSTFSRIEDFVRALRRAGGVDVAPLADEARPRADVRNPYKGLNAFEEIDAADFHGRADLTDRLTSAVARHRLVAVVGPSGSGKSSVVRAGLTSALRTAEQRTLITEMFPGAYPFEELESALTRISVTQTKVMEDLLGDDRGLIRVLKQVLPEDGSELLLVIDQFEELFSVTRSAETRELFLNSLTNAVRDPRSRLRVVFTLRADFFDRPLDFPSFGRLVEAGLVPVATMTDTELAQTISAPAAAVGVEFDVGLVAHIVSEVGQQVGGLPLLQFALTELFDQRTTNSISLADYQACGGIFGALATRAEQSYLEMGEDARDALQHAMLRMVAVGARSGDDLRLRVRRADLHSEGVADAALTEALNVFGVHRLVTFDLDRTTRGPTVEVAHEALLREWPRLAGWIETQRDDLVVRRRLATAMTEWRDAGEDPSFLPSGIRLTQFEAWGAATKLELAPGERQFLQEAVERERQRETNATRRRRAALVVSGAAAVLLALVAAFALLQRSSADDAAFHAETSRLAATVPNVSELLPELGLLVAAESHNRAVTPETLGALQRALMEASALSIALPLGFGSSGISADGNLLSVWDAETQQQGPVFDLSGTTPVRIDPPTAPIESRHARCDDAPSGCPGVVSSWVDFAPGGEDLLVQWVDGVLHIYSDHDFDQPLAVIRNAWVRFATSPDGKLFAHGTVCATVEEFDALTAPTCPVHGFQVVDLDSERVVFAQSDDVFASNFSWSTDGSLLHRVDGGGEVTVWETSTWSEVAFVGGEVAGVSAVDHPTGGDVVVITGLGGSVTFIDAESGEERSSIAGLISTNGTASTEFSSDGTLMLSALVDSARLWDLTSGQQIGAPFLNDANSPRTQSGDVLRLATEINGVIHVWNLDTATWFSRACEEAGRNMTREEWEQFGPRDTDYRATCPQWGLQD